MARRRQVAATMARPTVEVDVYKMIFGAKRKAGMSREDFGRYWTTEHAAKAIKVPSIKRYVINLAPDLSGSGREMPYDGFAEVWFDNLDDMREAQNSPATGVV